MRATHIVIPAQAGIQHARGPLLLSPLDSRLRGNDDVGWHAWVFPQGRRFWDRFLRLEVKRRKVHDAATKPSTGREKPDDEDDLNGAAK